MVGFRADGPARDRVIKLMEEKDRIENEIKEHAAVLATNNIGMQEPLVDDQGYPRGDVDVYKVRNARNRIICLQNDHKDIMKKIERGLNEVHAEFLGPNSESSPQVENPSTSSNGNGHTSSNIQSSTNDIVNMVEHDKGFAVVRFVDTGSPADLAGICEDDEVVQFGSVNYQNFNDISQIHYLVTHSVGQRIHVQVKRNRHIINLTVVPRPWAQPGLLGCHIVRSLTI